MISWRATTTFTDQRRKTEDGKAGRKEQSSDAANAASELNGPHWRDGILRIVPCAEDKFVARVVDFIQLRFSSGSRVVMDNEQAFAFEGGEDHAVS